MDTRNSEFAQEPDKPRQKVIFMLFKWANHLESLRGTVGFMSVSVGSSVLRVPCATVVVSGPVRVVVVITPVAVNIISTTNQESFMMRTYLLE